MILLTAAQVDVFGWRYFGADTFVCTVVASLRTSTTSANGFTASLIPLSLPRAGNYNLLHPPPTMVPQPDIGNGCVSGGVFEIEGTMECSTSPARLLSWLLHNDSVITPNPGTTQNLMLMLRDTDWQQLFRTFANLVSFYPVWQRKRTKHN
jgi:hypothetical protein